MDITEFGISIEVNFAQLLNVFSLIIERLSGIFMEVKPLLQKAPLPIEVIELGIVTDFRL